MTGPDRWLSRAGLDRSDAKLFAYLPVLLAASWVLPTRAWPGATSFLTGLPFRLSLHSPEIDDVRWPERADPRTRANRRVEQHLQYLRDLRPGGWRPTTRIVNLETLRAAVEAGHGVILWIANTFAARLVGKKALHGEGFRVHHLSRPSHGGSRSPLGIRYLNGIVRAVEDRYLGARVMVHDGTEFAATSQLRKVLVRGGIVSITIGGEGRQTLRLPFQGGVLTWATGAPALAHATGAALLPVFCLEDGEDRSSFTVIIDRPLSIDQAMPRPDAIRAAMHECLARHEAQLHGRWDQWRGFENLSLAGGTPGDA